MKDSYKRDCPKNLPKDLLILKELFDKHSLDYTCPTDNSIDLYLDEVVFRITDDKLSITGYGRP